MTVRVSRPAAIRVRALAKINLSLRILGVRPDGYHELRTVFQSIALHDTLLFREARGSFRIICDDGMCPTDDRNLVWRAASLVWAARKRPRPPHGVTVHLSKRIPLEAGLGGGSSDAAATIRALSALWRVPFGRRRTRRAAAALGADVPFFLAGGTSLAVGRGDRLRGRVDLPHTWVVLVIPPFGVSTKRAFAWWDRARQSDEAVDDQAGNDLEGPVVARHPEIGEAIAALREAGARRAAMSGSGSAVFGLFDREAEARRTARRLARPERRILVTRTVGRSSYARLTAPRLTSR